MTLNSGLKLLVMTLGILVTTTMANEIYRSIVTKLSQQALMFPVNRSLELPEAENLSFLRDITRFSPACLKLLYDRGYEDSVKGITRHSSRDPPGLMVFENDGKSSTLQQILTPSSDRPLLLVLCSPQRVLDIFRKIRRDRLGSHHVNWIVVLEGGEREVAEASFNLTQYVLEGTRVSLVLKGRGRSLNVSSVEVDSVGSMRLVNKGQLKRSEPYRLNDFMATSQEQNQYWDFLGRKLIVAVNDLWPYFGFGKVLPDGTVTPPEGIDVSLLKALSKALNFTYETVRPKDKKWGNLQPDGTVTGFIGMVARWEANFAVTTISITDNRATVVDFTFPYYREPLCIFSKAPKQKSRALAILEPFTLQVWICIVISTLAIGPILRIYSKVSQSCGETEAEIDLQTFSFNVFRNLINQGNLIETESWPLKAVFFFWYIFCLIVSALYSGSLTAYLAIPAYETPIDSLEDLPRAVQDGSTLGVMEDSSHEYVFKEAEDGIYKKTWDLFNHKDRSKSFVNSPKTGIIWVLEKDFVYIGPKTISEIIAMKLGIQKFHIGRIIFFTANIAIPCPPGAPYVHIFSKMLIRMTEGGLILKWKQDEIRKIPQTPSGGDPSMTSAISLTHLQAAFLIIFIGYLLALGTILLECLWWRCNCFGPFHGGK